METIKQKQIIFNDVWTKPCQFATDTQIQQESLTQKPIQESIEEDLQKTKKYSNYCQYEVKTNNKLSQVYEDIEQIHLVDVEHSSGSQGMLITDKGDLLILRTVIDDASGRRRIDIGYLSFLIQCFKQTTVIATESFRDLSFLFGQGQPVLYIKNISLLDTYIRKELCTKPGKTVIDEIIFDFDTSTKVHTLHGCVGQVINDLFIRTNSYGRGQRTIRGSKKEKEIQDQQPQDICSFMCTIVSDKFSDLITIDKDDEVPTQTPSKHGFQFGEKVSLYGENKDERKLKRFQPPDFKKKELTRDEVLREVEKIVDQNHSDHDMVVQYPQVVEIITDEWVRMNKSFLYRNYVEIKANLVVSKLFNQKQQMGQITVNVEHFINTIRGIRSKGFQKRLDKDAEDLDIEERYDFLQEVIVHQGNPQWLKAVIWVLMGNGPHGNCFYQVIDIENWVDWYIQGDLWTGMVDERDEY